MRTDLAFLCSRLHFLSYYKIEISAILIYGTEVIVPLTREHSAELGGKTMIELKLQKSDDSYSTAAKQRMEENIEGCIETLKAVGTSSTYMTLLYGAAVQVDGRNRKVTDFADIEPLKDKAKRGFIVALHRADLETTIIGILRENGFTKIEKLPDTGFLKVEVERPSMDQLDAWAIECDRHVSSALSRSGKIKVDALSQIAKGVKNEFIEPVVAHRARLQLDDLSLSSENFLKVIGMTRKVHFLGYGLQLSTDEENKILSQTRQPIFKKVGEFMEG